MTSSPISPPLTRSTEMLSCGETALLVIDMQTKLLPAMRSGAALVHNVQRLVQGTQLLGVPTFATQQYPLGLGPTIPELAPSLPKCWDKRAFSIGECGELIAELKSQGIFKVLVCGIETHVCVAQSVLDLLSNGFRTFVAVDATSSRFAFDAEIALRRLDSAGATLVTTESALFEFCQTSEHPHFKAISKLVKEAPPAS